MKHLALALLVLAACLVTGCAKSTDKDLQSLESQKDPNAQSNTPMDTLDKNAHSKDATESGITNDAEDSSSKERRNEARSSLGMH